MPDVIRFAQELKISRIGFGNTVQVDVGTPYPLSECFEPLVGKGCSVKCSDKYPYIAKNGYYLNQPSDFPELAVDECFGRASRDYMGESSVIWERDFSDTSYWGVSGLKSSWRFEVGYDSTVRARWSLDRVVFQKIVVRDSKGKDHEFKNVPALSSGEESVMLHMWGQTDSWGSEGKRILFIPWQEIH